MMALPSFDPEFSGPSDWASMYRACGLQVVPGCVPDPRKPSFSWKRPALPAWKEFQENLVPDATFERWYGRDGEWVKRYNMGILTGRASGNCFIIDLDDYKGSGARQWLEVLYLQHTFGIPFETVEQVTGGGGRQMLFRGPPGWEAPTNKTQIGIDIRGQGGFAMLPPSRHISGNEYAWKEGCAPWETEIADAPTWLIDAIEELVLENGGPDEAGHANRVHVVPPTEAFDPISGRRLEGRETAMYRLVWGTIVNWRRESPVKPSDAESQAKMEETFQVYLRNNQSRFDKKSGSPEDLLEQEGRGISTFRQKWRYAMSRWDKKVAAEAAKPRPGGNDPNAGREPDPEQEDVQDSGSDDGADEYEFESKSVPPRFPFEKISDLRRLPPLKWLVEKWVPEGACGIIYGKWAAGKSFLGFDLGLHLAYGMTDWHGAALPGEPVDVLILAREGHQGFVARVDAFKAHYGLVDDPAQVTFMRAAVSFMRDEEFAALCTAIRAQGTRYKLVLIDTVARVLPGVDMNEQSTVTLFMERCQILAEITGAAAIGVHHQNKSGAMMGSTYFEANSDFVFEVTRTGDEDMPLTDGEIQCTKMKDGEDRWKRQIKYKKVQYAPLNPDKASLVVEAVREAGASDAPKTSTEWPDKSTCIRVLAMIREAWDSKRPWSNAPQSRKDGRYAPERILKAFSIGQATAENMIEAWLLNDILAVEIADKNTKTKGLRVIGRID